MGPGSKEARERFSKSRIVGASFFDLDEVSNKSSPYSHMLPSPQQFQEYVGQVKIITFVNTYRSKLLSVMILSC